MTYAPDIETLIIRSRDRTTGTPSNFEYTFTQEITNISTVVPVNAQIVHSQYTINRYNNKIYFTHTDATDYTASISHGFYELIDLLEEIMTQMNSLVGNTTIRDGNGDILISLCNYWAEYDTRKKLVTIKNGDLNSGNFSLYLSDGVSFGGGTTNYTMGYTLGMQNVYSSVTVVVASLMPSLSTKFYEVRVEGLIKNKTYTAKGAYNTLMLLDQLQTDGSLNYAQDTMALKYKPKTSNIRTIKVVVYNDVNREAILLHDWTLKVAIIRNSL